MSHILMQNDTVAGFLAGALCSVVTEEGNGVYELSYAYPVTGRTFLKIAIDRFNKANPFRALTTDTDTVKTFIYEKWQKPLLTSAWCVCFWRMALYFSARTFVLHYSESR